MAQSRQRKRHYRAYLEPGHSGTLPRSSHFRRLKNIKDNVELVPRPRPNSGIGQNESGNESECESIQDEVGSIEQDVADRPTIDDDTGDSISWLSDNSELSGRSSLRPTPYTSDIDEDMTIQQSISDTHALSEIPIDANTSLPCTERSFTPLDENCSAYVPDATNSHGLHENETNFENNFTKIDSLDGVLDPSLCSITQFETLLVVLHFSMRHGLTGVGLIDLLNMINFIFGKEVIPASKFRFDSVFKNNNSNVIFHFYCQHCMFYLGTQQDIQRNQDEKSCTLCNKSYSLVSMNDGHFFLTIPVADQLRSKLEGDPMFYEMTSTHRFKNKVNATINDIYDGLNYASLLKDGMMSNPNNLSITFNTDGAPVFKSCKSSVWPIQFFINELPPQVRFSPNNVLLAGVWFGSREPKMDLFLKPFVQELVNLDSNGFQWKHPDAYIITSKVCALCCCLDSVAKPMVQNVTQFNGYFGCSYCKHPGERIEGNQIRFTFSEQEERKDKQTRLQMKQAHIGQTPICGIKGISPLYPLPHFDIVNSVIIDYMHAVLLGVTRTMSNMWCDSSSHDMPFYIGRQIKTIDKRIVAITPPSTISRRPRPLSDRVHYKANEWRSWLLLYSLPCLRNILPVEYFNHFALLVSSIYILLQESISYTDVDAANDMLTKFVVQYEVLYGKINMTYNVHLMSHLGKMVSLWGPLWAYSAFSFESGNGFLLRLVKGTKGVATQIVNKYCLYTSIPHFIRMYNVNDGTLAYCSNLMGYPLAQVTSQINCNGIVLTLFGSEHVETLSVVDRTAFVMAGIEIVEHTIISSFKKMIINGVKYHSSAYTRSIKSNDCIVYLADGNLGIIKKIIQLNAMVYAVINLIRLEDDNVVVESDNMTKEECVPHLKVCHISNYLYVVSANSIMSKGIYIKPVDDDKAFVSKMPNRWEKD